MADRSEVAELVETARSRATGCVHQAQGREACTSETPSAETCSECFRLRLAAVLEETHADLLDAQNACGAAAPLLDAAAEHFARHDLPGASRAASLAAETCTVNGPRA